MRLAQYQIAEGTYTLYDFDGQISLSYSDADGTKKVADFDTFADALQYLKRLAE